MTSKNYLTDATLIFIEKLLGIKSWNDTEIVDTRGIADENQTF